MPRWLAEQHRCLEVLAAMTRYLENGYVPPEEWADEILDRLDWLRYNTPDIG
jgi:hypothetical protein